MPEETTPDKKTKKTKKSRIQAVAQDTEEAAAKEELAEVASKSPGLNLNDLRVAYVVGLTAEGNFVFEVAGKEKGLVELLGLHRYATKRVETLEAEALGTGDKITMEVGKAILQLSQKVDQLLKLMSPPQNKL